MESREKNKRKKKGKRKERRRTTQACGDGGDGRDQGYERRGTENEIGAWFGNREGDDRAGEEREEKDGGTESKVSE